jgi:Fe-S-cluster-containing dehydrogenase component
MSNSKNALLIDYTFCTGCHSCETACRTELGLTVGQWGIKLAEDGPRKVNGHWDWNYIPVPTGLCDLCEKRVTAGKEPTCVHHCQAKVMYYGPVEEMAKQMADSKRKMVMYTPVE